MDIKEIVNNPHDVLFKRTMVDKDAALDFMQNYLPEDIIEKMDLSELQIAKDTFIDEKLKQKMSDMLYKVNVGGKEAYVYLLFEHKSYYEIQTPVQLLGYMCDIWDLHWQQHKNDDLPVIVPVLIYHGERDWDKGERLANVLEEPLPGFEKFVPDYNFLLYDFSGLTEKEIKGNIKLKILSYLFSKIYSKDLKKALENVIPLLVELQCQNTARDYILTVLNYITNVFGEVKTIEDLKKEVEKVSREGREMVMTFTQEAMKKGKKEELIDTVKIQLKKKFKIDLSAKMEKGIETADIQDLAKIRDNIFEIESLDEVKEILGV